jgi:hypothetical protein
MSKPVQLRLARSAVVLAVTVTFVGMIASPTAAGSIALTPGTNVFGANMFGIAAGGSIQNDTPDLLTRDLDEDQAAGAKWLRVDINWSAIQNGGPSSYQWGPFDAVVQGAEARGMAVLGAIVYTPSWARPSGAPALYGPNPNAYATFAATAVRHYAAMGVHAYEIWNEPNWHLFWYPAPNPAAYAALLKAAYPAIKSADPSATVVTGGMAPAPSDGVNYSPVDFLKDVYANGGHGYFDAVGQHPYCSPAFPGQPYSWSAWYQMYGTSPSLRSVMVANGDRAKKIWATEYGAPTDGPTGDPGVVTLKQQAAMLTKAYQLFAGYTWAGPMFIFQGRDQGTDPSNRENFYGLLKYDFTPKPAYAAYQEAVAAF